MTNLCIIVSATHCFYSFYERNTDGRKQQQAITVRLDRQWQHFLLTEEAVKPPTAAYTTVAPEGRGRIAS